MAKPKESPLFEEPEFDEKEFLSMERDRAKGILVIFVIGALSGLLAGYLQLLGYTYLSVLIMLAVLVLLAKLLGALGIKVSDRTSHKIINYGTYILTWLLFWIIFLNPPFHVVSSPQIQTLSVAPSGSTNYTVMTVGANDIYQSPTGSNNAYSIHLTYKYSFTITKVEYVQQGGNTPVIINVPLAPGGYLNFTLATGSVQNIYDFSIYWASPANSNPQPLTFTMTFG